MKRMFQNITYTETVNSSIGTGGDTWTATTCPKPFTFASGGACYQNNFTVVSKAEEACNSIDLCKGFDMDTFHSTLYIKTIGPTADKLVPYSNVNAYVQTKNTNWIHVGLLIGGIVLFIILIIIIIVVVHKKKAPAS